MKKMPLVLFLVALFPSLASAQHWTPEEQALLDQIEHCWDAWVSAGDEGTPDTFFQQCPHAEDSSMWWTEFGMPQTLDRIRREWPYTSRVDLGWIDMRPVAVRIWGDVGMVQLYGTWKAAAAEGPVTTEYKRTELFRLIDGRWTFLGGQGTPSSAKDADPYG
jgi:hypothetical protein